MAQDVLLGWAIQEQVGANLWLSDEIRQCSTWIRRIPASPEAAKRRVDRRWVRIVEFRQFLTFG